MSTTHPTRLDRRGKGEGTTHGHDTDRKAEVAGVCISHPDRAMFPSLGVTKEGLAHYYAEISAWMLPYVRGRPLTLVRAPRGAEAPVAITRHAHAYGSLGGSPLRRVTIREKTKVDDYLVADSACALVALAQLDVLEVHTWNACAERADQPDRVVFDLDPGGGVTWGRVVEAALLVRDVLSQLELESFVKTTGGRGLHVVVPLAPRQGWDECLALSRAVATRLAQHDPRRFTASMVRSARAGRVYIDYLRNHRAASSIAEYSTRAVRDAPVAAPVAWGELEASTRSDPYTMASVLERLRKRARDPWEGYAATKQRLRTGIWRAVDGVEIARGR